MTALSPHPSRRLAAVAATAILATLLSASPVHASSEQRIAAPTVPAVSADAELVATGSDTATRASIRTAFDGGTIDTFNRQQVLDAFTNRWVPAMATPLAWTGDPATCQPGSLAPTVLDASLAATNYLRDMAGVLPVTADPAKHALAQQAALMMDANNTLNHNPPATWRCYTPAGAEGASSSNLAIGYPGVRALDAYMTDAGVNNAAVGHRTWILHPAIRSVGFGGTARAHAMHVIDRDSLWGTEDVAPVDVAWPTAGYFPEGLYPKAPYANAPGAGRWSYTTDGSDHDFTTASVTVTQTAPTVRTLPVIKEVGTYGLIVFIPTTPTLPSTNNNSDVSYQVTISGIRDFNGAAVADITYSTTLIASPPVPGDPNDPRNDDEDTDDEDTDDTDGPTKPRTSGKAVIKGAKQAARPGTRLRATLTGLTRAPSRVTYQWLRNGRPIKNAHRATYRVARTDARSKVSVKITVRKPRAVAGTYRSASVTIRRG